MNIIFKDGSIDNDERLFCELYTTYKSRLIYFAIRFIKSEVLAEDIVQEAFISIWLNRKSLDADQSIESYLFTTVRNKIFNQLKNIDNEIRLKEALLQNAVDYSYEEVNPVIEQDFENLFRRMLGTLTPQQQRIFIMSREEKLSHKEIASQLDISLYTVNQHITEALQTLRGQLSTNSDLYTDCIFLFLLFQL